MLERIDHAPCGVIVLDQEGEIKKVNYTLLSLLGYQSEQLIGHHFEKLLSPASKMVFYSHFYPTLYLDGTIKELIIKCRHTSGTEMSFMLSGRLVSTSEGKLIDCVLLDMNRRMQYEHDLKQAQIKTKDAYRDIAKLMAEIEQKQTELIKINEQLTDLSITDKLTGLKNRRFFQERLEQLFIQFKEVNQSFYMVIIDIDYFKKVNDTYGHHAGDDVLAQLANLIQSITSDQLEAFRYGGEEFIILITTDDDDYVISTAERIRQNVEQAEFSVGHLTISIGGAKINDCLTMEHLFTQADKALYQSKQNGRNQVTFI